MKHKSLPTTDGHFKSYGGEAITRMPLGAAIGAAGGLCVGLILCLLVSSGNIKIPGLTDSYPFALVYFLILMMSVGFGISAGLAVGIGVPRIKLHPKQGLVKTWKPITIKDEYDKEETVYIPEETRKHRQNNENN